MTTNITAADTSSTPATHAVSRQRRPLVFGSLDRIVEPIADGADRDDRGIPVAVPQFPTQVPDVDIDNVGLWIVVVSPHGAEYLLAREHLPTVAQQIRKQL